MTSEHPRAIAFTQNYGLHLAVLAVAVAFFTCFIACITPATAQAKESNTITVGYYENEVFEEGAQEGAVKRGYAYEY